MTAAQLTQDTEFRAWIDHLVERYGREEPQRTNAHLSPVARVVSHPVVFDFAQWVTAGSLIPARQVIASWIGSVPHSRTLDVCCGTGNLSHLAPGDYLGVDLDPGSIRRARQKHHGDRTKRFVVADVTTLELQPKSFDVVLFMNGIHHLQDELAINVLKAVARATAGVLIIGDPAIETRSPMSKLLFKLEQGHYLRPRDEQVALLRRAGIEVEREQVMYCGFAHQRVMFCRPAA